MYWCSFFAPFVSTHMLACTCLHICIYAFVLVQRYCNDDLHLISEFQVSSLVEKFMNWCSFLCTFCLKTRAHLHACTHKHLFWCNDGLHLISELQVSSLVEKFMYWCSFLAPFVWIYTHSCTLECILVYAYSSKKILQMMVYTWSLNFR